MSATELARAARSDHAPRPIRCCFSRAIGSPSGHAFHSSAGRYRDGSSEVECAPARYVTHSISVGPRLLRARSAAQRDAAIHGEEVVAVDAQRRDAAADAARGERRPLAAGDPLERRDRPLVVDDVEDHRRPIDGGERQRVVEVGLGRRAVADPRRRDARVALDRRRHRPADGLDELRGEVAGDREEPGVACTST